MLNFQKTLEIQLSVLAEYLNSKHCIDTDIDLLT